MAESSRQLSVLLDADTNAALEAYMAANEMTLSQATRMLLALALRAEGTPRDESFRRAAFREGLHLGVATLRKKVATSIQEAFTEALGEMDAY